MIFETFPEVRQNSQLCIRPRVRKTLETSFGADLKANKHEDCGEKMILADFEKQSLASFLTSHVKTSIINFISIVMDKQRVTNLNHMN